MDSGVLFTLGVVFGGMATDVLAPRPPNRSLRRWLIEALSEGIRRGTAGPLRLVERDCGLCVVGCGLSQRVDSEEEAEELIGALLGEVRPLLGGYGLDTVAETSPTGSPDGGEQEPAECRDGQYTEVSGAADDRDMGWVEWPETTDAFCDETGTCPQAAAIATDHGEMPAPGRGEPEIAGSAAPAATDADSGPRVAGIEDVDETLSDIVSQMRACCPAA